jgi:hypothetical protein
VRSGADSGCLMHGQVDVIVPHRPGLTGVCIPMRTRSSTPSGQGWAASARGAPDRRRSLRHRRQDEEERVPLDADLHAAMVSEWDSTAASFTRSPPDANAAAVTVTAAAIAFSTAAVPGSPAPTPPARRTRTR